MKFYLLSYPCDHVHELVNGPLNAYNSNEDWTCQAVNVSIVFLAIMCG